VTRKRIRGSATASTTTTSGDEATPHGRLASEATGPTVEAAPDN
jgi:hypothetical protein